MNTITILGRLGQDPEQKTLGDNIVTEFSVAVSVYRNREQQTNWYRCSVWGKRGDFVVNHFRKGSMIAVTGELYAREYQTSDGRTGHSLDVAADRVGFAGGAQDGARQDSSPQGGSDDIPF